jgi:sugar lactone lactonase YvrE
MVVEAASPAAGPPPGVRLQDLSCYVGRLKLRFFPLALALLATVAVAHPASIVIDDRKVFPESLDSTPDGTLYIGSNNGRIYRARAGSTYAEPWLDPAESGLHPGVRGVVADARSNTLWICDNNGRNAAIVRFALDSGRRRDSFAFPGGGHCNDIALKDGRAYITDTGKGRILRLEPGSNALTVWFTNESSDRTLDGIVWSHDGKLYINTVNGNHLIRVDVNADGSAGHSTILQTSLPLYQPDGLRRAPDGRLLMVESQAHPGGSLRMGRLDEVIMHGDRAEIKVLREGFEYPTAVTVVGRTAWVLESKFDYLRNPTLKGREPEIFDVRGTSLPARRVQPTPRCFKTHSNECRRR